MERDARPIWRTSAWVVAFCMLGVIAALLAMTGIDDRVAAVSTVFAATLLGLAVVVWALWQTRRQRRRFEEQLTAWAADRAAQQERLRIARELHDLASHGLGLITVRAAAARRVDSEAERAQALADIEEAGRVATSELRRMLALLRSPEQEVLRHPVPTLADLPRLVDEARQSGSAVALDADLAALVDVPSAVQSAAAAVVREGMANALRHAGPVPVVVRVFTDSGTLRAEVANEGVTPGWAPHAGAGQGLLGLRERVAAFGGEVRAEPVGTGFVLAARFPLADASPREAS